MSKKLSQEHQEKFKKLNNDVTALKLDLGTLAQQQHMLLHASAEKQNEVDEFMKELTEEYGPIELNQDTLKDGSYKEIKQEDKK